MGWIPSSQGILGLVEVLAMGFRLYVMGGGCEGSDDDAPVG